MSDATDSRTRVALLRRLRDRDDQETWNALVDRYAPRIYRWCRRYRLPESDAADVTEEVIRKLLLAIRHFQHDPAKSGFREWLKAVVAKTMRDLLRAARSPREGSSDTGVFPILNTIKDKAAVGDLTKQVEEAYEKELLREAALRVQLGVEPQTWDAYRLAVIERLSPEQVAEQVGISTDDVNAAKSHVIKMLREEVKRLDGG
jgi:RNA polymerase sigma factor (sigma-70 family)